MNNGLEPWSQEGKSKKIKERKWLKLCHKLLNNFKIQNNHGNQGLKYGRIS